MEKVDYVICAQFLDPDKYPKWFKAVSTFMIHVPCRINKKKNSPCMNDVKCSKFFPKKKYNLSASLDDDGFAIYRRRDTSLHITCKDVKLDNRCIVPYNPMLFMKYQSHINIEYCHKSNFIKYLFKYINKGVDRVTMSLSNDETSDKIQNSIDEIKQYYDCR